MRRAEGLDLKLGTPINRTKVGLSVLYGKMEGKPTKKEPIEVNIEGSAVLGGIELDLTTDLGGVYYSKVSTYNIYDILLYGEWLPVYREGFLLMRNLDYTLSYAYSLKLIAGTRLRVALSTSTYSLSVNDKLMDKIENPLSETDTSGILFFGGVGGSFRVSFLVVDVTLGITIPKVKNSFIGFSVGGSF